MVSKRSPAAVAQPIKGRGELTEAETGRLQVVGNASLISAKQLATNVHKTSDLSAKHIRPVSMKTLELSGVAETSKITYVSKLAHSKVQRAPNTRTAETNQMVDNSYHGYAIQAEHASMEVESVNMRACQPDGACYAAGGKNGELPNNAAEANELTSSLHDIRPAGLTPRISEAQYMAEGTEPFFAPNRKATGQSTAFRLSMRHSLKQRQIGNMTLHQQQLDAAEKGYAAEQHYILSSSQPGSSSAEIGRDADQPNYAADIHDLPQIGLTQRTSKAQNTVEETEPVTTENRKVTAQNDANRLSMQHNWNVREIGLKEMHHQQREAAERGSATGLHDVSRNSQSCSKYASVGKGDEQQNYAAEANELSSSLHDIRPAGFNQQNSEAQNTAEGTGPFYAVDRNELDQRMAYRLSIGQSLKGRQIGDKVIHHQHMEAAERGYATELNFMSPKGQPDSTYASVGKDAEQPNYAAERNELSSSLHDIRPPSLTQRISKAQDTDEGTDQLIASNRKATGQGMAYRLSMQHSLKGRQIGIKTMHHQQTEAAEKGSPTELHYMSPVGVHTNKRQSEDTRQGNF